MNKLLGTMALIIFSTTVSGQVNPISEKITTEIEKIYEQDHINGFSVAIVDQDSILYTRGFGYADIKTKKPYTAHTVQNIGSVSKTLIGVALLKAQEEGKLNLDDPINNFLPFTVINPYFPDAKITLRHLANHTSGIKDPAEYYKKGYVLNTKENPGLKVKSNFQQPGNFLSLEEFLRCILSSEGKWYKKKTFSKEIPGTFFEYSNIGAGLAALVLEKATGKSFDDYVKKHILEPLQMSSSGWSYQEINTEEHTKLYNDPATELAVYRLVNYPDGGLITSSTDLGKYLNELIKGHTGHGNILKKDSYKELYESRLSDANFKKRSDNKYNDEYDMHVFIASSSQGQIGHTGSDPGVVSFMFFDVKSKIGKILLINTELNKAGIQEFIQIWKVLEKYENQF